MKGRASISLTWLFGLVAIVSLLLLSIAAVPPQIWPSSTWMGTNIFPITSQAQFMSVMRSFGFQTNVYFIASPTVSPRIEGGSNAFDIVDVPFSLVTPDINTELALSQTSPLLLTNQQNIFFATLIKASSLVALNALTVPEIDFANPGDTAAPWTIYYPTIGGPTNFVVSMQIPPFTSFTFLTNGGILSSVQGQALFAGNLPVIPATNLPIATVLSVGIVRPDGSTITISSDGTITAAAGGSGTGSSNVNFVASSTIAFTTVGPGTNQAYIIPGAITSNLFSGLLNYAQIAGVPAFLLSSTYQSDTNWFVRTNENRTLTIGNSSSIFTGSLSGNASSATTATHATSSLTAGTATNSTSITITSNLTLTATVKADGTTNYAIGGMTSIQLWNLLTGSHATNMTLVNPIVTGLAGYTNTSPDGSTTWWFDGYNSGVTNLDGHWGMTTSNGDFYGTGTFPSINLR